MSDPQFARADEIEEQAADWLQRRHFWNWTDGDQAALDAWLAQSPAHLVAYLRLESALGRTDRLAALRAPDGKQPAARAIGPDAACASAHRRRFGDPGSGRARAPPISLARPQERIYSTPRRRARNRFLRRRLADRTQHQHASCARA